ncbi:DUF6869 domain-containing protein [Nocardioides baekrokdamisoli]|uniref:DUF6869 domain-containing protein n=1 Tax=Nocardioides baekrokdamisoli TaxID=1804624 RepID=UPI000F7B7902|nr:hypothetical protein [Nocardioides baekrokdamisoli]
MVEVLAVLAAAAAAVPEELDWVGAGPLEDLLSHRGHGASVINEVEQTAARVPALKAALASVWVSEGVETDVRHRLVALGARDLSVQGETH